MTIGPIQAFVIGFPDNDLFEGRIAEELARLSDVGQIRIIDAVFVMREGDDVAVLSVSDLDDDQRAELRAAVGALVGLGVAGVDGAVAGAALGASIDADAPDRGRGVGGGAARRPARWQLGAGARDRAPLGDPAPRRRPRRRRRRARAPLDHPEDLIAFGMDLGDEAEFEAELDAAAAEAGKGGVSPSTMGSARFGGRVSVPAISSDTGGKEG